MSIQPLRPYVSVVVPLFNEQESVEPLHRQITAALRALGVSYEIIFVDDGSRDRTFAAAESLAALDPCLRVIKFRANAGQTPAMAAGIDHARGDRIVTMDGDLQNDPDDIGALLRELERGNDLAVGWRYERQDKFLSRRLPSVIANRLIGRVTGVPIKDNGCSLKAFRAKVIQGVPLYSEMHRFIPAMLSVAGPRIAEIKVKHHARRFGQSKYGLSRTYRVLLDLLIVKSVASFSDRPLLWFALLGVPAAVIGAIGLVVGLGVQFVRSGEVSLPIAGSGLLFLALAVFLFLGGALAELVFKTGDVRPRQFAALTMTRPGAPDEGARE
jgi:glycosyltransferase involved in cell wall biosynthesis